jgi:outer membrane protein assembly factor BamB
MAFLIIGGRAIAWPRLISLGLMLNLTLTYADDWPQFRGPQHDGISGETQWRKNWSSVPPKPIWSAELGIGFSGVSVAHGRVLGIGHIGDDDVVQCFDENTGEPQWEYRFPSDLGAMFYIGGPGSTPTIDEKAKRVYALGKWGELFCFDLLNGNMIWQRQVASEEDLVVPDWGFNGSPLISGELIILNLGTAGMAVDKESGKTVWKSEGTECGYSTPLPYEDGGKSFVAVSSGEAYSGVEVATGKLAWSIPWFTRYGVNAADPIIWKGQVFVSSGYQKGAGLFSLKGENPEFIWKQRRFRAQQNGPVRLGEYLYGFDGDSSSRAKLKCLAWSSGEVVWEDEQFGYGALSSSDGYLIVIASDGRLGIAKASPEVFQPVLTKPILKGDCWTAPVLANGRILCRNSKGNLVSLDVRRNP